MRRLFALVLVASLAFAASGSFVGQVVKGPYADAGKKWIYVQGPHGSVRRVDVSAAKVRFGESAEKNERAADALRVGAQVRVTASQDEEGDWKASKVEVVKVAPR